MNSLYPIGSIYFGTQDTCPLEIILSNSTWTKVASNIVIDVNTSASVAGNGLALGLQGPVNVSANPNGKYGIIQGTNDVLYAEKPLMVETLVKFFLHLLVLVSVEESTA